MSVKMSPQMVVLCLLLLKSAYGSDMEFEFVYLISGSDEFGGNAQQQYHQQISAFVNKTLHKLKSMSFYPKSSFGAAWALPGSVWPFERKATVHTIVNLTKNMNHFHKKLKNYMDFSPGNRLATTAGLNRSLGILEKNVFSYSHYNVSKIVITLLHEEILISEIKDFLSDECSQILTYVTVFPWFDKFCSSDSVVKVLGWFNKYLPWTEQMGHDRALCSEDEAKVDELGDKLADDTVSYLRYLQQQQTAKNCPLVTKSTKPMTTTTHESIYITYWPHSFATSGYEPSWTRQIPVYLVLSMVGMAFCATVIMMIRAAYGRRTGFGMAANQPNRVIGFASHFLGLSKDQSFKTAQDFEWRESAA